jgi:flagellar motility protein MotE (MotC chaperone)
MEPAKAAAIMEKLKIETVVLILRNMKGKPAGQIIALLKPELGAQVVEKLSKRD